MADETETYELIDVPALRAQLLMAEPADITFVDSGGDFEEMTRRTLYEFYDSDDNVRAKSLFDAGWERGIENKTLRLVEAEEMNEPDADDDDTVLEDQEARWHFVFGYLAGQFAAVDGFATPWTKSDDDDFLEEVSA